MSPELERMYQQWVTDGRPGNKHPRSLFEMLAHDRIERLIERKERDEQQRTQPHAGHDAGVPRDGG